MKLELKNLNPYVAVIRQLMYPHECESVTRFLGPSLDFPPGRMSRTTSSGFSMPGISSPPSLR